MEKLSTTLANSLNNWVEKAINEQSRIFRNSAKIIIYNETLEPSSNSNVIIERLYDEANKSNPDFSVLEEIKKEIEDQDRYEKQQESIKKFNSSLGCLFWASVVVVGGLILFAITKWAFNYVFL